MGTYKIPPNPPFPKGGTQQNSFKSPPLKKRDLGEFKNRQSEGIFGKYHNDIPLKVPLCTGGFRGNLTISNRKDF